MLYNPDYYRREKHFEMYLYITPENYINSEIYTSANITTTVKSVPYIHLVC